MTTKLLLEILQGTRGVTVYVHEADYNAVVEILATQDFSWVPVESSEFVKLGHFILREGTWTHNGKLNNLIKLMKEEINAL